MAVYFCVQAHSRHRLTASQYGTVPYLPASPKLEGKLGKMSCMITSRWNVPLIITTGTLFHRHACFDLQLMLEFRYLTEKSLTSGVHNQ